MRTDRHDIPELLAPAGGMAALRAAVANGADAVYLGLDTMNARRGAENFTIETLADACRFAHLRGVRIYLTANIALLASELADALRTVEDAWSAGVDAVIVQDLGLLRALRMSLPEVRVHASTQINAHSSDTIRSLAEKGVERVTLAREVSLDEMGELVVTAREVDVELESFVHGALCMCYSGQCLLSSLIGGRSANRGLCAQPCRLAYELVDEAERVLATPGAHLLSPKDLAGISALPAFIEAGVASLKIEGRMKSPEYVALVTGVYRSALDRAASASGDFEVRDGEMSVLSEAFSRGFTDEYLRGGRGNEMMSYGRPNNRGVPVGRIASAEGREATIQLDTAVDSQDTIEVWTSRGRFAQPIGPLRYKSGEHTSAPAGVRATVTLAEQAGAGDRVFRVRNAALSAAAERTFSDVAESAPMELQFSVRAVEGSPLRVTVRDRDGVTGSAEGPVIERARTKAITAEEVIEHVGRLGNTPYRAVDWSLELSPSVGMGYSSLHRVRREALVAYEAAALGPWHRPGPRRPELPSLSGRIEAAVSPRVVASVWSLEVAMACLDAGADECQVPSWAIGEGPVPEGIVVALPRICHDAERGICADRGARKLVAGTLGSLRVAGAGKEVEAHWSLNALNPWSLEELADDGASLVWLSPELSGSQLREVCRATTVPTGTAIAGRQELMVTEHCILMAQGPCSENCTGCARRRHQTSLRDRKGFSFPVRTDPTGRSHIFNSVPLDLTHALGDLLEAGVHALRLDLESETTEHAARETRRVVQALAAARRGETVPKRKEVPSTSGHFFRGVR